VHLVELTAGQGVRKLVAQRVDDNPRRFMTPRFVVFRDDNGLAPEAPVLRVDEAGAIKTRDGNPSGEGE
jgi:hypothetical protein